MAVNFIKKILLDEADEKVHVQFVRFSRGTFENRAVLNVRSGKIIKAGGTFDLVNDMVLFASQLSQKFSVSGTFFTRENPEGLLASLNIKADVKKKKNLFQAEISAELNPEKARKIYEASYCLLLDVNAEGISLKTKKKLPRLSKSAKEKGDDKFCVLEIDEKYSKQLHDEFLFDIPLEFKKARIAHTFIISEVILPKGEKNFELMRLNAKKKGKIVRQAEVDGKILQQEKTFEA
mgnify:CR=1 FL=1